MIGIGGEKIICARDVELCIDGKRLLQVRSLEIRKAAAVEGVRSCFMSEDAAFIRRRVSYKVILEGIRFKKPFENCSFADLDNFTLTADIDGRRITLSGCIWEDFLAAADKKGFSEHICARALRMTTEDIENGGE